MSIFDEIKTLAGVSETQKMGSPGQAKGKDPMPKHLLLVVLDHNLIL